LCKCSSYFFQEEQRGRQIAFTHGGCFCFPEKKERKERGKEEEKKVKKKEEGEEGKYDAKSRHCLYSR
jgi:hypothetical protein